ncbi:MAG: glycosyltransferase family 39 protein [Cyclobacteriaceae bacterium]|nr:glycosyltransferase family 39 protein [Cyclobacteriaceae bacterium]
MNLNATTDSKFLWRFTIGLALLVYALGISVTIMEIDGAVYAEIAREMYRNGNYLEIFYKGQDWLDKPHFQFWVTALSFRFFGISSFSYKLPAVLFMLMGAYYTYLFGKKFYSRKHGYLAALLLITSQHIITSNSDVRAEPYLTGLTIFALYYLAIYLLEHKFIHLIIGSLGLACLLMTKGLFTIIPVASGLGLALLYEKKWKEILHWQWIAVVALTLIFIAPTLYGYYIQFDLHPEKIIFDQQKVSGINFFLWDSQWGRFANTGPIKGSGDPVFFLHTMLWAYLPWAFLAYFALFIKGKSLLKKTNKKENYTFFGFLFLFIVFNLSSFQLPHYLNALFPFLSIITADTLLSFAKNRKFLGAFYHIHIWSSVLLIIAITLIHFIFSTQYPNPDIYLIFLIGVGIIVLLLSTKGQKFKKLIFIPAITVLLVNYYINRSFYPQLLKYQAESEAAFYMKNHDLKENSLVTLGLREDMISVLQDRIVPVYDPESVNNEDLKNKYVFTNGEGVDLIQTMEVKNEEIHSFPDFRITTLNVTFFNKKTRDQEIETKYLLKIKESVE